MTPPSLPRTVRVAALLAVTACGSRTGLDLVEISSPSRDASLPRVIDSGVDARPHKVDAALHDTGTTVDAEAGADAGRFVICPSAILAGSPLPMLGNCSTRDGRARVLGPTSPHLTWTTPAPAALAIGGFVAADATGGVYLAAAPIEGTAPIPTFGRVDGTTGNVDWSVALPASTVASLSPFLDPSGTILDVANTATGPVIEAFDPATGAVMGTPLAASLADIGIPAVGSEGSLYVQYVTEVGMSSQQGIVSRLLPDRTVAWTTKNLSVGPTAFGGFLTLALGHRDVVVAVTTDTTGSLSIVYALSSETGATIWSTDIHAQAVNGPVIGPDGSIAVVALDAVDPSSGLLYILEPTGSVRATTTVPGQNVFAIGVDGTIIIGGEGMTAVSATGTILWTNTVGLVLGATIDAAGTVVATFEGSVFGFDLSTGATLWSLQPPAVPSDSGPPCRGIQSTTLTSSAGLVGIGCGVLFGASD